jgi:iron(III) transport system substrate-binding protein
MKSTTPHPPLPQRPPSDATPASRSPGRRSLGRLFLGLGLGLFGAAPFLPGAEVNLYTARHYPGDDALYERFEERTGIQVNVVDGKGDELLQRIRAEGEQSPADVFITVDAGRLWAAEEAGILQPVETEELLASVPSPLRAPDGLWYGLTKRARVLFYDRASVDPSELSTYEELAAPRWKGEILIRSSSNVYNQSLLAAIIAEHGEEYAEQWAEGMVANFARKPQSNDTGQIRAVAAGLGDVAIANHYYYLRLMQSDNPDDQEIVEKVGMFFPNQESRGTHVNISGGGVVAGAENREEAIRFLEFLVSPEAQAVLADGNYEFPVNPNAPVPPYLSDYSFREDPLPASVIGEFNPEAIRIFDRAGWR